MSDTAAAIAGRIAEQIWSGELPAGHRLPPERALAPRMGASRQTVRAAIRRLERAGVVRVVRGRAGGAVVDGGVVPPELLVPGARRPATQDVHALLEARRALEPAVAWLAAQHATPEDLDALTLLVRDLREAPATWEVHVLLDSRFHLQIARAAHNEVVWGLMVQLHVELYRVRHRQLRRPHDPELLAAIHERTLQALLSGDRDRIERDLAEHLGWLERAAAPEPAGVRSWPETRSAAAAGRPGRAGGPPAEP
ncbi:MAG: FCD domain-containing protein [bacterium]|jgi:DNA-binding FadR family transcriptional regulator|nr:FCD domain-containing protein [bacterium]